jgi:hypothetical protein
MRSLVAARSHENVNILRAGSIAALIQAIEGLAIEETQAGDIRRWVSQTWQYQPECIGPSAGARPYISV